MRTTSWEIPKMASIFPQFLITDLSYHCITLSNWLLRPLMTFQLTKTSTQFSMAWARQRSRIRIGTYSAHLVQPRIIKTQAVSWIWTSMSECRMKERWTSFTGGQVKVARNSLMFKTRSPTFRSTIRAITHTDGTLHLRIAIGRTSTLRSRLTSAGSRSPSTTLNPSQLQIKTITLSCSSLASQRQTLMRTSPLFLLAEVWPAQQSRASQPEVAIMAEHKERPTPL